MVYDDFWSLNRQIVKEGAADGVKFTTEKIACRLKEFEREFF